MTTLSENRLRSAIETTTSVVRPVWRFTSGQYMDGNPRTDAGWFRHGTYPLPNYRATRWGLLSRVERAGVRFGSGAAAGVTLWGYAADPQIATYSLQGLAGAGAFGLGVKSLDIVKNALHHREWIQPLHVALEGPLGLPAGTAARSYIHIPREYPGLTDIGRIDLPPTFVGVDGAAATIGAIVKAKLGLSDATVSFKVEGRRPHLLVRQTPRPPARVMFAEEKVQELILSAAESAPLIGLGPQSIKVSVDLDAESPHILVSASTGGGKSVITRTMASQMLHNGSQLVVLDFKRHSHKWARGLPNVLYCREIGDIHDALVRLGAEGHHRNIVVDDWEGEGEAPVGPRMGIILEEANATVSKLKRYWGSIRRTKADEFGPADPKESPAIDALREILFMGRAVKMHVFLVAQSATATALGGPEVRECFATRILARYTRNAWNMLVPEVQPVPRSTRHIGRAQVVLGGVAHETQVVFFSDSEARTWATAGTVAAAPDLGGVGVTSRGHTGPLTSVNVPSPSRSGRDVTPILSLVKDEPDTIPPRPLLPPQEIRYTLAGASRDGIVPLSADALRQAKRRDPEFPAGEGGKWTAEELQKWHRNRVGAAESIA
ncbi:helicase HerA domain-containing protein [Streptomyces sp. NPDC056491]|uniref:helicase HerA domain-containing protein n=1 Tax=Streptomyces sp. NPDC056491 TaxID=3345837 RepID=UPI003696A02D